MCIPYFKIILWAFPFLIMLGSSTIGKNVRSQKYSNRIQRGSSSRPNRNGIDEHFITRKDMFFLCFFIFYCLPLLLLLLLLSGMAVNFFLFGIFFPLGYMKGLGSLKLWHIAGHSLFWFLAAIWLTKSSKDQRII